MGLRAVTASETTNPYDGPIASWGELPGERDVEVAVLLPCRDEERTIAQVVHDFRQALPRATIFVYDNASTDRTAEVARRAGAVVRHVEVPGKGNVIRRMFSEIDA